MKGIVQALIIALSIVILTVVGYVVSQKFLKDQAIDGCLHLAQVHMTKGGQDYVIPELYWYNYCLKEKGYK